MKIQTIEGNGQRLDGGAMFGNAPKKMWEKWIAPDEENRIPLATRCLLLECDDGRKILFETGIGAFFPPKMKARFAIKEEENLLIKNLEKVNVPHDEIDCVILSHLHFDHAGGLLSAWDGEEYSPQLLFPKAKFYVGKEHWERAQNPHSREKASFLPFLHTLLKESGRLNLVEGRHHKDLDFGVDFSYVHGHTVGLMMSKIALPEGPLLFVSDLIPGAPWVHLPITMGYDRFPELLIEEKKPLLEKVVESKIKLFFTHDPKIAIAQVRQNEKGAFFAEEVSESLSAQS